MIQSAPESASIGINGPEVRRRRKLLGQNGGPFAERCGISAPYLSAIELGRRTKVSPQVFGQICNGLGIKGKDRRQLVRDEPAQAVAS